MARWSGLLALAGAVAGVTERPAAAQDRAGGLEAVSFMVGCWAEDPAGESGLREIFAAPAANMLTGLSQFWRDGRIVDFEFHRIDESPEGPVLTPYPRGVASDSFRPREVVPDRIVWENPEHDFPQRITYTGVGPDTLVVRIEGGEAETARFREWRMARTADCSGRGS